MECGLRLELGNQRMSSQDSCEGSQAYHPITDKAEIATCYLDMFPLLGVVFLLCYTLLLCSVCNVKIQHDGLWLYVIVKYYNVNLQAYCVI